MPLLKPHCGRKNLSADNLYTKGKKMKIVAFGDSIMEGKTGNIKEEEHFLFLLGKKLGSSFTLINAGVGGHSARNSMERYEKDVLAHNPDLVILEFGGNNHDYRNPARIVTDDEFKGHLHTFKTLLPASCKVLVLTFPPIIDEQHLFHKLFPDVKLDEAVNGHRQIVRDFAKENNFPLLDLYKLMYDDRYKLLLPDGIHFNPAGHAFLAEKLYEALKEYLSL